MTFACIYLFFLFFHLFEPLTCPFATPFRAHFDLEVAMEFRGAAH